MQPYTSNPAGNPTVTDTTPAPTKPTSPKVVGPEQPPTAERSSRRAEATAGSKAASD